MSKAQLPVSVGEIIADKYRVDRVVGSGGMSIVVLAWHLELEQEVAIKVLHGADLESDAAKRFRREARAAARIRSEHVSRILDVGTLPSGSPFMVMEYLAGNDLAEELAREGPLPVEEIVLYVLQAIEALAEAHAAGIVHRDLKPENLFLAVRPDGSRIVKVLDFGISKSMASSSIAELSLTKTAAFVGSPLYMSPEQMRSSRSVDGRTDIWSIGAILYEAVSGRLPYYAESIGELCTRLIQDSPPPLGEIRAGLPLGFETVVLRCLEKDRERRYATLADLARALAPFCASGNLHADRAERVLARASQPSPPTSSPGLVMSRTFDGSRATQSSLAARMESTLDAFAPQQQQASGASWVTTYVGQVNRRKGPIAAVLLATAAVGLGWVFGSSARDEAEQRAEAPVDARAVTVSALGAARPAVEPAGEYKPAEEGPTAANTRDVETKSTSKRPAEERRSSKVRSSAPRARATAAKPRPVVADSNPTEKPAGANANAPTASVSSTPPTDPNVDAWDPSTFGGRY